MSINGTTGINIPITTTNTPVAGTESKQNTDVDFSSIFSDSLKDQALQSMIERMKNPSGGAGGSGGHGGTNAMPGGLGDLGGPVANGGINAMLGGLGGLGGFGGLGGIGGIDGSNPLMGVMPSISSGMENSLVSAAEAGEMSGVQLMLFMFMMMMQTSDGGGDTSFMMQIMASMLSNFSNDVAANRPTPMATLGEMQIPETQTAVTRMVDAALEKVGYQERNRDGSNGSGNYTKFGAWYGMDGQPWCAMFVSWAADQAGILHDVVPKHASTSRGVAAYQEKDMYEPRSSGYKPREGDAIYFQGANGQVRHVGIVVAYDPATNRVYTVEGNTSNAVRIRHYDANSARIHGYGKNGGTGFGTIPSNSTTGAGANDR